MTTVVYSEGRIYADTYAVFGDFGSFGYRKIGKINNFLFGVSNRMTNFTVIRDILSSGVSEISQICEKTDEDMRALIIHESNPNIVHVIEGNRYFELTSVNKIAAIGSGAILAMALFDLENDIMKIMEIVSKYDIYTGNKIESIGFDHE